MFTGLVEALGSVRCFSEETLAIEVPAAWKNVKIGSSVAVHGACLTVIRRSGCVLFFNVIGETKARSVIGKFRSGQRVNLERAMKWGARFEGHMVLGHVDGVGQIVKMIRSKNQMSFQIAHPKDLKRFFVEKGSVAVNGVSLTLGKVTAKGFWIHIIPHTLEKSDFGNLKLGDDVNLEGDIVAKFSSLD